MAATEEAQTADAAAEVSAQEKWGAGRIPLHDYIGVEITSGPPAVATIELIDEVKGAFAPLHGGLFATLADIACAAALTASIDPAVGVPVTTELSVRLYAQPRVGPVRAVATVVHQGKRLTGAECVLYDGEDRQLARGHCTFMMVPLPEG